MWELRFESTAEKWPILELVLSKLEPAAITTTSGNTDLFDRQNNSAHFTFWEKFEVLVLFEDMEQFDVAYTFLANVEGVSRSLKKRKIRGDVDWSLEWKKNWIPITLRSGIHISPSWLPVPVHAAGVIRLDPGRAFGTGTHETTKLCFNFLDDFKFAENLKMIDYGCGSGILSLVAAALGCKQIIAIDNDPLALEITEKNVATNSWQKVITVATLENIKMEKCDLLIANILLEALVSLKAIFSKLVRKNGFLVLSGITTSQTEALISSYDAEFEKQEIKILNDWCMLVFSKR